jgi:hypothetical protein
MNHCQKIRAAFLLCFSLSVGGRLFAADTDAGLLGKNYVGTNLFLEHVRTANISDGFGGALTGNFAVAPHFDLGAIASLERFSDYSIHDDRVGAYARAFTEVSGFRPFADLSLGGTWQSSTINGVTYRSNDGIFGAAFGVEAPVAKSTALIGRLGYNKYFDSKNGHYWLYSLGLNHWLTPQLNLGASVSFQDSDSITYTLHVVLGF